MAQDAMLVVEPFEDEVAEAIAGWRQRLTSDERVAAQLGDADLRTWRVLGPELPARKRVSSSPVLATVFDPVENRAVQVTGQLDSDEMKIISYAFRPSPTPEELGEADEILRADESFAEWQDRDDVIVYQPMPPLSDIELEDGTAIRRIGLAIYDPEAEPSHRYVAVNLADRSIEWDPGWFGMLDGDCEERLPVGVGSLSDEGGRDWVRVRVLRGGEELWNLIVVRPRASSPTHLGRAPASNSGTSPTVDGSCCGRRTCPSSTCSTTTA
jgi:hypothetical protein